ncbi:nucleotide pyrophosphatase [Paenibacillus sp. LMG 31456]|uniref:Nucleotide pyrophosphatase n=1 Tax=Paenibacillus foliorum TaxID=2654974 RepID=A0A972GQ58_9BACL|nr:alkaline phosphatase family protein [Paenibacillus foliorum]NOU94804.1 nucleotide pyrophosphatase [Paenibacillus foliorum]
MGEVNRVIVIGWDGAGSFVQSSETPQLDAFFRRGASSLTTQAVMPTISAQCWGSMFYGVTPDKHQLDNTRAEKERFPDGSPYTSVFKLARQQWPDAKLASFSSWEPINYGIIETSAGVHTVSMPDAELAAAAGAYIQLNPDVKLMFVHFDLPDAGGHRHGYNTPGQWEVIAQTDRHVAIIMQAIEEAGLLQDSLIIQLTDHGGGGAAPTDHGSDHPLDLTIFWSCAGPGIEPGSEVPAELGLIDTAAVIAHALGLMPSDSWDAKLPLGLFK